MIISQYKHEILFLSCIFLIRVAMGIYSTVPSTTILDLARLLEVPQEDLGITYTARSLGSLLGGFILSAYLQYKPFTNKLDPFSVCGISCILQGILFAYAPFAHTVSLLCGVMLVSAISYGFLDVGMQSLVIETFGPEKSKGLVQAYHMAWSIGSMVSPYLTSPFCTVSSDSDECNSPDDVRDGYNTTLNPITLSRMTTPEQNTGIPLVFWPWFICGVLFVACGFFAIFDGFSGIPNKLKAKYNADVRKTGDDDSDTLSLKTEQQNVISTNEKIYPKNVFFTYDLYILIAVFGLYFCNGGPEHWYVDYSYTYALCTRHFSKTLANTLVTIFWTSMMIGRGTGIILTNYIKPQKYFVTNTIFCTISYILLYVFWEDSSPEWILWFATILAGLNYATLYGCGVSWAAEYLKITSKYSFVFSLGNFAGQGFAGPISSSLVNSDPEKWFMWALVYQTGMYLPILFLLVVAPKMMDFQYGQMKAEVSEKSESNI